jgi:hypothetical protein
LKFLPRDQLRGDGRPGWHGHRRAAAEREGEDEQKPRVHYTDPGTHAEDRRCHEHPKLRDDEITATIDDVGQRARGQR